MVNAAHQGYFDSGCTWSYARLFQILTVALKSKKAILLILLKAIILFHCSTPSGFVSSRSPVEMLLWKFASEIVVSLSSE